MTTTIEAATMDRPGIEEYAKRFGCHVIFRERKVLLVFRLLGGEFLKRFDYRAGDGSAADAKAVTWLLRVGPLLHGLKQRANKHRTERDHHGA